MTLYRLTVEKQLQVDDKHQWGNVYWCNAATILDAQDTVDSVAALEQAILKDYVAVTRLSVANPLVPGSSSSRGVFLEGSVAGDATLMLPLFNTVFYHFNVAGGRPSPKYLRLPLQEGEITGGVINTAVTNDITTNYAVPLVALGVTDEDGQVFLGYDHRQRVQMRQLGWHRRAKAGFHRGWVAN